MRNVTFIGLVLVLLSAIWLSGCIGGSTVPESGNEEDCGDDCPPEDLHSEDGRDLRTDLLANDTVSAPQWEVGDLFAQHIFDGPDDTSGYHIDSVVVEDSGNEWVIAPNNEDLAVRDAFWDYPFLGAFNKGNLATSAYGNEWDFFFEFPLEHGKTWQRSVNVPHATFYWSTTYDVSFEVEYAESVDTFEGRFPGFYITGTTSDGDLLFSYYYVPMIGWYDHFYWYNLETEDPDDWRLHAMSMGTGENWTGTTYAADVEQEILIQNFVCPFLTDEMCPSPSPHGSFTLSEDTHLFGVLVTAAWGGTSQLVIQTPDAETRTYEHTNTDPPDFEEEPDDFDAVTSVEWVDEASIPGEWQIANVGAGVFWGMFITLVELDVQETTIE